METEIHNNPVRHEFQLPHWSNASRVAFRFCFVYFGIYCLATQILTSLVPLPSVDIPDPSTLWPLRPIVLWTATHILHTVNAPAYADTGSGDKTFDWVLVFCLLAITVLATAVWSVLDRKRDNYIVLHKWFQLAIRFFLAAQMLSYGLAKVVPLQMPFPFLTRLVENFGDFSPMGVLWSAIGASPGYEIFAGCAEVLGGILLIIPRTATLGALICLADMVQVFMLNMTYDVPVKLLSFHLILLSLFLLAPDLERLANFFVLNRATEPSAPIPLFTGRRANRIAFAAQILLGVWLLGMNAYGSRVNWYVYGGARPKSPLYGIWEVEQQLVDGQPRSPLLNDYGRWRRVIFDFPTRMTFQRIDDSFARRAVTINVKDNTLTLTDDADKNWKANFTFQRDATDQLTLDGNMDGHKTHLQLKLLDRDKFLLVNRGFHWISEFPFNR
jgi:uncharacterized membrane protein YphA (DoxX/SURF4 family)